MMDYMALAKSVVERASSDGVEVDVYIEQNQQNNISISKGEVEKLSQSGERGIGVRVIDNGRTGYAYTSDFSDDGIEQTWRTARELAAVATPDEHRKLPMRQELKLDEDLELWDDTLADVPLSDKIELAKQTEAAALAYDERVIMARSTGYADGQQHVYLANSNGFAEHYGGTWAYVMVTAVARDDNGMTNATSMRASRFYQELDPQGAGADAAHKAVSILSGQPVSKQKATVVFDHFVGAQILGVLSVALSGENWQRQRSFLIGKMGQQVGNDMVTLLINGRLKRGFGSAPFDDEGVPTRATRLIDEGVLQAVMHTTYSAAQEGPEATSTASAGRGSYRNLPRLQPANFYIQPGQQTREEIIAGIDKGLFVISAMQTGGINPVTGDCSMGVNGLWIENGKITGPVGGVTVATTLPELLNNITAVGNDLYFLPFFGGLGVATLRVDNVTIGGTQ